MLRTLGRFSVNTFVDTSIITSGDLKALLIKKVRKKMKKKEKRREREREREKRERRRDER